MPPDVVLVAAGPDGHFDPSTVEQQEAATSRMKLEVRMIAWLLMFLSIEGYG